MKIQSWNHLIIHRLSITYNLNENRELINILNYFNNKPEFFSSHSMTIESVSA